MHSFWVPLVQNQSIRPIRVHDGDPYRCMCTTLQDVVHMHTLQWEEVQQTAHAPRSILIGWRQLSSWLDEGFSPKAYTETRVQCRSLVCAYSESGLKTHCKMSTLSQTYMLHQSQHGYYLLCAFFFLTCLQECQFSSSWHFSDDDSKFQVDWVAGGLMTVLSRHVYVPRDDIFTTYPY